ncbi:MAG TPA: amino acid permease [Hyphomicrobiaceae bacterium]|nr:amino acid permease [Hyphomicrobiaceae bacterium]
MSQDAGGARLPTLSVLQASAMLVGMVIGVFIFKAPSLVAWNTTGALEFLALWAAGGLITLIGALCYAELATSYPHSGGEYHYLTRAYGRPLGFLFAWGRMTVIQTGAIAAVAFAYGDYASVILPLGPQGPAIHAAIAVAVLTAVHLLGTRQSAHTQTLLTALEVLALLAVSVIGFIIARGLPSGATTVATGNEQAGLAMVFILLAYGGWNELSYISGEMRDVKRTIARVLILGTLAITLLYLLVNWALLSVFGLEGLRKTGVPVSDLVGQAFGQAGAVVTALMVCAMALSTMNASIFTGARTNMALGQEFSAFSGLGPRNQRTGTPTNAVLAQSAIVLALIGFGAVTRNGFQNMVEYTAPVFWGFMLLVGVALFVFRVREPAREMAFRVPLYPLTPALWCAAAIYMLYSSVAYTGWGALIGIAVLGLGVPVYLAGRGAGARVARAEGSG